MLAPTSHVNLNLLVFDISGTGFNSLVLPISGNIKIACTGCNIHIGCLTVFRADISGIGKHL